jgi:hypothetical protein
MKAKLISLKIAYPSPRDADADFDFNDISTLPNVSRMVRFVAIY